MCLRLWLPKARKVISSFSSFLQVSRFSNKSAVEQEWSNWTELRFACQIGFFNVTLHLHSPLGSPLLNVIYSIRLTSDSGILSNVHHNSMLSDLNMHIARGHVNNVHALPYKKWNFVISSTTSRSTPIIAMFYDIHIGHFAKTSSWKRSQDGWLNMHGDVIKLLLRGAPHLLGPSLEKEYKLF